MQTEGMASEEERGDIKRMNIAEFRAFGYLQAVNRAFFHPRGMALEVVIEEDGTERLGGIWDYRDDPEGMLYGDLSTPEVREKAERVQRDLEARKPIREQLLGFWQQPIGDNRHRERL